MNWMVLCLLLLPSLALAHELQSTTQYVSIRPHSEDGLQQDVVGTFEWSRKIDVGLQGTYLERYDFYENRLGGFVTYRPNEVLSLELRHLQGNGNEILPEQQTLLTAYYSWFDGHSPYLVYRDTRYSQTHLNTVTLGMEVEKIPHVIFIPQVLYGKATFETPAQTRDVYNIGLRAIYYEENYYTFTAYLYGGKEPSQGIIGASTILVDTMTGGIGAGYYIKSNLKADLTIDHTDYDQLNTQFVTTTLNFTWKI